MGKIRRQIFCCSFFFAIVPLVASARLSGTKASVSAPEAEVPFLRAEPAVVLKGKGASFDFMEIDSVNDRLLAAHSGAGSLVMVDLKTEREISAIEVGHVQGVAIDYQSETYILGDADEHKVIFVSSKSLKKVGEILVTGPVDAIAFDDKNGLAYAGEDDGNHVWIIDVKAKKLISTLEIPGAPEVIAYDSVNDRLYQNIKDKNLVAVINPKLNSVESSWSTLPVTSPHGMAIDKQNGHLFIAGHNGKLVTVDVKSGRIISDANIAIKADQIAFDEKDHVIYCATKGFISAVRATGDGLVPLTNTPAPNGAHTLAVDPSRQEVWISYADQDHSYLQKYRKTETSQEKL